MCDCYGHECEVCGKPVPMHIGDFAYPRKRFKVWCAKHVDQAPPGAVIFETVISADPLREVKIGWRCAILGPGTCEGGNNGPNIGAPMKQEIVPKK